MGALYLIPLWSIAFTLIGISGSLRRLVTHHEAFPAPVEADENKCSCSGASKPL
jgi:hypothetical protein